MYESAQDAHGDVEHMANDYNEDEPNPTDTTVAQRLCTNGIKGLTELGTCQAQGIQTQVTQHIAKQTRSRVVSLPQTRAHIEQRIAVQVVQEENT